MNNRPIVLITHQSAEMYGSDKVLLNLAAGIDTRRFEVVVLLPEGGPLFDELKRRGIEVHTALLCKVSRALFSVAGLLSFPWQLYQSLRNINQILNGRKVAIVHTNTLAILSSPIWARLHGVKSIWHVHEILLSPRFVKSGFPLLVRLFSDCGVCNSRATEQWLLAQQPALQDRTEVLWNGLPDTPAPTESEVNLVRRELTDCEGAVLFGLVGRINSWKGHQLLVEAADLLMERGATNFRVVMIGDVFGDQEHFKQSLEAKISTSRARAHIKLCGFRPDIERVWAAIDVAVVPSTEPEPFGMVAIEAMAAHRPVIAANHGGLTEIVEHNVTGLLFTPNSAAHLADAMQALMQDESRRRQFGASGRQRQRELFSVTAQVQHLERIYQTLIG